MGKIVVDITLTNVLDLEKAEEDLLEASKVRTHSTKALVDTGTILLSLPQDIVEHLGLKTRRRVEVEYADGSKHMMSVAGGVLLDVVGRTMQAECLVLPPGTEPLIGVVVLESLDLIPDCIHQELHVRPQSPLYPLLSLK